CLARGAPNRFSPTRPASGSRNTLPGRGCPPTADGPFTPGGSSTYNADARPRSACGRGSPSSGEPPSVHAESSYSSAPAGAIRDGSRKRAGPRRSSRCHRMRPRSGRWTEARSRSHGALAGSGAPSPEVLHEPHANRHLSIYEVDLGTGNRHAVIPAPQEGDAFAPCVASGYLYWTHAVAEASAVVVPTAGGTVRLVMRGAEVPSWRPDGRQIGFAYGDWRWVDWGIDWDGGAVDVDTGGRPVGPLYP